MPLITEVGEFKIGGGTELEILLNKCSVPKFDCGDTRQCEDDDFKLFTAQLVNSLSLLLHEIENIKLNLGTLHDDFLAQICILLGENSKLFPWNNQECVNLTVDIWSKLASCLSILTLEELLIKSSSKSIKPILKKVIQLLRPKLQKDSWRHHPASVQCFSHIVHSVSPPYLHEFIHDLLPTALIIVDDYVQENKIVGVLCLSQLIENMTIADLKFHGYGLLIYKTLEKMLRERDPDVASTVIPTTLSLLSKMETNIFDNDANKVLKWSRFDDAMEIILDAVELEHLTVNRAMYISFLDRIIKEMGVRIIRWTKKILRIIDHYLEVAESCADVTTVHHSLQALKRFIIAAKPVLFLIQEDTLYILLRLFCQFQVQLDSNPDIRLIAQDCLILLMSDTSLEDRNSLLLLVESKMNSLNVKESVALLKETLNKVL